MSLVVEDVFVDRFMADREVAVLSDRIGYLFRAEFMLQEAQNDSPLFHREVGSAAHSLVAGCSVAVGDFSSIAVVACAPVS